MSAQQSIHPKGKNEPDEQTLLTIDNLEVSFPLPRKHMFAKRPVLQAVAGVSFSIRKGQTFGIVGESGSGKSTVALSTMRLVRPTGGRIEFDGLEITALGDHSMRSIRRRLQIIFQDPFSSLNPRLRAGDIVEEPLDINEVGTKKEREAKVADLFRVVGLRPEQRALFPHQFSGGQRQRIGIARALATQPDLIVCDEPVSALDVAIQAQILNLLNRLRKQFQLTYLFISHDLSVVQHMCDEIAVMYLGCVMEQADRISLFSEPLHPYTRALLSAVPSTDPEAKTMAARTRLEGDPPSPINPPKGCRFSTRCPFADDRCRAEKPVLRQVKAGHLVACHRVAENGEIMYSGEPLQQSP